jgi:CRP-like cAMP-binding protein
MSQLDKSDIRNVLLRALPAEAYARLQPSMEKIDLPIKFDVVLSDVPTTHVIFIESGLASVVATSSDDEAVEVGHVGLEGVAGAHVVLQTDRTPNKTFMQVAGDGIRVPVVDIQAMVAEIPAANTLLLNYVHCAELQLSHSSLANARYNMHERLARWLLMCHDRLDGDDLPLTHEFLSLMLGVRRSGVTNELHIIEGMLAIKATRANIRVTNREKLEEIAGGCYGLPEREYERLIGLSGRSR